VQAITRAGLEPLDFQSAELKVFELAVHYVFYCLENDESPTFGKKHKKYYRDKLKQFGKLGQTIRVGSLRLSVLVERAELYIVEGKVELAEIIKQLEATDES